MSNWSKRTLGQLVEIGKGFIQTGPFGSQLHVSDYVDEGIPIIMPVNLKENRIDISKVSFISEKDSNRLAKHLVKAGDIIYSRRGDVTQKALITQKEEGYFCGTGCLLIRVGDSIEPNFLAYFLSTSKSKSWVKNHAVGITMPNLNTKILSRFPISYPERARQKQIAKVLSDLDAKIEVNNKINQELEAMAKLIYDYWFVQFDFPFDFAQGKPDPKGKPYKSSGGNMVYSKELKREIPEGWEVKSLDSICERIQSGGTPLSTEKKYYNGNINWFTTKELQDEFVLKSESRISKIAVMESSTKLFPVGTVVIAIYAAPTVGRIGILTEESAFNQACCGIIPNTFYINKEYLFLTLLLYRKKLNVLASGTTQKNLGVGTIKNQLFVVPPPRLMQAFYKIVSPCFSKKEKLILENQKLSELRDWLLPMLMNGQVRVAHSDVKRNLGEAEEQLGMVAEEGGRYGN